MEIEKIRDTGDLFSLLRLVFLEEAHKELLENLLQIEEIKAADDIDRGLDMMRRDVQKNRDRLERYREELAVEFARLFLGPQNPVAVPFASYYLSETKQLMTDVTIQIRRQYLDAGMAVKNLHSIPDDHVALELEFMAYLAGEAASCLERGAAHGAAAARSRMESFLGGHLAQWLPLFAGMVYDHTGSDFYKGAAVALKGAATAPL